PSIAGFKFLPSTNTGKTASVDSRDNGQVKRFQEFRRNARCRDGLSSWCADCHVEPTRAYRQRRREAEAEAAWRRRKAETEKLRRWEVARRALVEQRLGSRPRHTVN